MSDDFEKAILFVFDQTGSIDPSLKLQAQNILISAQSSPEFLSVCLSKLESCPFVEVKFWCLQALHQLIVTRYGDASLLPPPAINTLKATLFKLGTSATTTTSAPITTPPSSSSLSQPSPALSSNNNSLPPFIKNKLAQCITAIAAREYPSTWPSFFQDLLTMCLQSPGGPAAVDLYTRILLSIDEDIISLEVPRSADEARRSMSFKDAMREGPLQDVAESWYALVATYHAAAPDTAAAVLIAASRYIHWIDIGLVANDKFVPLLYAVLQVPSEELRGAAAEFLTEIINKRMEASPKLSLIQQLGIVPVCAQWASAGLPDAQQAPNLAIKYARLLAVLATEVLESLKKVENSIVSLQAVGLDVDAEAGAEATALCSAASCLLSELMPTVLRVLESGGEDDITMAVLPFLSSHVARLRTLGRRRKTVGGSGGVSTDNSNSGSRGDLSGHLPPEAASQLALIGKAVAVASRYPADCGDLSDSQDAPLDEEEEAAVLERRNDLFNLFKSSAKLAPQAFYMFIGQLLSGQIVVGSSSSSGGGGGSQQRRRESTSPGTGAATGSPTTTLIPTPSSPSALGTPSVSARAATNGTTTTNTSMNTNSTNNSSRVCTAQKWQDTELALTLLYQLGEGASEEDLNIASGGSLAHLSLVVMQVQDLPVARHRLVALALLECINRYAKVLAQRPDMVPHVVLNVFLGSYGMGHPAEVVVRPRAAYLLSRLVKQLRSQLRLSASEVLQRLQPFLDMIAKTPIISASDNGNNNSIGGGGGAVVVPVGGMSQQALQQQVAVDDRLYLFDATGLLVGGEEFFEEKDQLVWLRRLLEPLITQINSNLEPTTAITSNNNSSSQHQLQLQQHAALIQQSLEGLTRLSKGFSSKLCTQYRPEVGAMLAGALTNAIAIPQKLPRHKLLRARFISFLHRMVETLGPGVVPFLPTVLEALLYTNADVLDILDVLALLNQLMTKFKGALTPLIAEVLPTCIGAVHSLLGGEWDWSGVAAVPLPAGSGPAAATTVAAPEDARERGELQKGYIAFLNALVIHEVTGALLAVQRASSDAAMEGLARTAATHVDPGSRKTAISTLSKLAEQWLAPITDTAPDYSHHQRGEEGLAGFRSFIIERLVLGACFQGLLDGTIDGRDAAAISLLTEVAGALIIVRRRCGGGGGGEVVEMFDGPVRTTLTQVLGWPVEAREALLSAVAGGEIKGVKEILKSALQSKSGGGRR